MTPRGHVAPAVAFVPGCHRAVDRGTARFGGAGARSVASWWRRSGCAPKIRPSMHGHPADPESTMIHRLFARALSLGLAAAVTLGMLGGIDRLSQPDEAAPQWALHTAPRA